MLKTGKVHAHKGEQRKIAEVATKKGQFAEGRLKTLEERLEGAVLKITIYIFVISIYKLLSY